MYKLVWQLSTGELREFAQFDTEQQALKARWNWATRGELMKILTPNGELI